MSVLTSSHFSACAAAGNDWLDAARRLADKLAGTVAEANVGFLYMTDHFADHVQDITALLRTATGVHLWVGATGIGICANDADYVDGPALAAMIGAFPPDAILPILASGIDDPAAIHWQARHFPGLAILHGDPTGIEDPAALVADFARQGGLFLAGGMASARRRPRAFAATAGLEARGDTLAVLMLAHDVPVATALSQGCQTLGPAHRVTRAEPGLIHELDGRPAIDMFAHDLRELGLGLGEGGDDDSVESLIEDFHHLFEEEIMIALPVEGSDSNDFMVRTATGIDPDTGSIATLHPVQHGEKLLFVHRDEATMRADLVRTLENLKARIERERGVFAPKGGLYIPCLSRMGDGGTHRGGDGEMAAVREVLGEFPIVGFYAAGEISNHRLYGYTAVIILFL